MRYTLLLVFIVLLAPFSLAEFVADARFGINDNTVSFSGYEYIYDTIYIWDGTQWLERYCSGDELGSGWMSSCSYDFSSDKTSLGPGNYFIAGFACSRAGSDFNCNDNKWLIASFNVASNQKVYIELEAESGSSSNMDVSSFVQSLARDQGALTLDFTVDEPGTYIVWARVSADSSNAEGSNSFYLSLDGATRDIYDFFESGTVSTSFAWEKISLRCAGAHNDHACDPFEMNLDSGSHSLLFEGREARSKLDKIIITNDMGFVPDEPAPAVCGDGSTDAGEQCDDGNTMSGDGCSSTCQTEVVVTYACSDGEDNDGDGLIDLDDPGCLSATDNNEFHSTGSDITMRDSISQFGITWTFDQEYPTGQFANGDYWVVGPVTIIDIDPKDLDGRDPKRHGSVVNIGRGSNQNGFDSRMQSNSYQADKDVATSFPFTVDPSSSLISAKSFETYREYSSNHPVYLDTLAILTVLDEPALVGSFRPPYVGDNKEITWNVADIDFSKLASVPKPSSTPDLATVERKFERPWMEYNSGWTGRRTHAYNNQKDYGREIGYDIADGANSLQLDYTIEEKETLAIRFIQYGIDIYGVAREGSRWNADGGHNVGRKVAITMAGVLLNDPDILSYADGSRMIFQDDQQTFYVTQETVDITNGPNWNPDERSGPGQTYQPSDIGMAEWGIRHHWEPNRDNKAWSAQYRTVSGAATFETAVAAKIMGIEQEWNHDAFFDYYIDRYWDRQKGSVSNNRNQIGTFAADLYRQEIE